MNIQTEKQLGKRIWSIQERIGIKGNATLKRKLELRRCFFLFLTQDGARIIGFKRTHC